MISVDIRIVIQRMNTRGYYLPWTMLGCMLTQDTVHGYARLVLLGRDWVWVREQHVNNVWCKKNKLTTNQDATHEMVLPTRKHGWLRITAERRMWTLKQLEISCSSSRNLIRYERTISRWIWRGSTCARCQLALRTESLLYDGYSSESKTEGCGREFKPTIDFEKRK